jgi:hypothetical protein
MHSAELLALVGADPGRLRDRSDCRPLPDSAERSQGAIPPNLMAGAMTLTATAPALPA